MSNVVQLHPRVVKGRTGNCTWSYAFENGIWKWRVEVIVAPQVFSGTAASEQEAKEAIKSITRVRK